MKRVFLFFFLLISGQISLLSQPGREIFFSILKKRGEIYTSIPVSKLGNEDRAFIKGSVDKISGDTLFFYLGINDTSFLYKNLEKFKLLTPPSMRYEVSMSDNPTEILEGKAYPTYSTYLKVMEYFRDSFPEICRIDTLGVSVNNRLILAAVLNSSGKKINELPVAFFSSTIHGDETAGFVLMLLLIRHLLEKSDPEIDRLLSEMTIVINPLANPDGTYFTSDTTVYGSIRYNLRGIDLNRNYPDPEDGEHPDGNPWQPENIAMMNYMQKILPSISSNFHGGVELVNYPFDTWPLNHPDSDWFRFISREYVEAARSVQPGYMDFFPDGVTPGYEWYEVNGGRQDYVCYFLHGRETTIELSDTKLLPEDQLLSLWDINRKSMINYLNQGLYGIHGRITDSITSGSIAAEIRVKDHDRLNSSVFSDPASGRFVRYLKSGMYDLEILAEGYQTKDVNNVRVNDFERTELNIQMIPGSLIPDMTEISVGPNPFQDELTVFLELTDPGDVHFRIYDIYGMTLYHEFVNFPAGFHEHTIHPSMEPGFYILKLEYNNLMKKFRIIKINEQH